MSGRELPGWAERLFRYGDVVLLVVFVVLFVVLVVNLLSIA